MPIHDYRIIAIGWSGLIIFLTIFWVATLSKLTGVLKERLAAAGSRYPITGMPSVIGFILGGGYKNAGDERLVAVCQKLRKLLYGYLGVTIAYIIFMVKIFASH